MEKMENNNTLKSGSVAMSVHGQNAEVFISDGYLKWTYFTENSTFNKSVPMNEIIAVTDVTGEPRQTIVHYLSRLPKHVWTTAQTCFTCDSPASSQEWKKTIEKQIADPKFNRPQNLLVFVNPSSGGGRKSEETFKQQVLPLLELASIRSDVIVTDRGGQAEEILQTYNLESIDGILCVGGDGTFSQVANGLLRRTIKDNDIDINQKGVQCPKPKVRIAQIPSGSADVYSEFFSIGTRDAATAALHVILGDEMSADVISLHQQGELVCFTLLLLSYGAIGDMLSYTESKFLRWFGPLRYLYGVSRSILQKRQFHAHIEYTADKSYKGTEKTPYENEFPYRPLPRLLDGDEHTYNPVTGVQTLSGTLQDFVLFPIGPKAKVVLTDPRRLPVRVKEYMGNGIIGLGRIGQCTRGDMVTFVKNYIMEIDGIEYYFSNFIEASDELRITITPDGPEEDALFFQSDGECYYLKKPLSLNVRMHHQSLRIFSRGLEEEA